MTVGPGARRVVVLRGLHGLLLGSLSARALAGHGRLTAGRPPGPTALWRTSPDSLLGKLLAAKHGILYLTLFLSNTQ
jgi:hypothetical protein